MRTASVRHQTRVLINQQHQTLGKRHGSRIPGPLEARRRAAKRKYAAPATLPTERSPRDTGDLLAFDPFRVNKAERKWNGWEAAGEFSASSNALPPASSEFEPVDTWPGAQAVLPPWLTNALRRLKNDEEDMRPAELPRLIQRWRSDLHECQSLENIHAAATRSNINLSHPSRAHEAFTRYLQLRPSHDNIIEYLSDRARNPPAAYNTSALLATLATQAQRSTPGTIEVTKAAKNARQGLRRLRRWISTEIRLGSMEEEEIRHFLAQITKLQMATSLEADIYWRQISSIVSGFKSSRIRPLQQAHSSTIHQLLKAVALSDGTCVRNRSSLARDIIIAASDGQTDVCQSFIQSFVGFFLAGSKACGREIDMHVFPVPIEYASSPRSPTSNKLLQSTALNTPDGTFEKFWLSECLRSISGPVGSRQAGSELLGSVEQELLFSIASQENVLAFLEALKPTSAAQLFDSYLRYNISTGLNDQWLSFSSEPFRRRIRPLGKDTPLSIDALPQIHRAAYIQLLASVYSKRQDPTQLENLFRSCHEHGQTIPIHALTFLVNDLSGKNLPRALKIFLAARKLRIDHCVPLAAAIIASPSIANEVVISLLQWSLRPPMNLIEGGRDQNRVLVPFLHQLAAMLSTANSGSASDRVELIRRVLKILEGRTDLIKPGLLQSLIRAEVRCYQQQGVAINGEIKTEMLNEMEELGATRDWAACAIEEEETKWNEREASTE